MQVVIDVPNWLYNAMLAHKEPIYSQSLGEAVRDGIPLPKCHGRLIDADKLELDDGYSNYDGYYHKYSQSQIFNAPTIIEADKEYEVEVITRGKCMMCGKELTEGLFFCKECGDKANSGK